jgi:hypothetical protein
MKRYYSLVALLALAGSGRACDYGAAAFAAHQAVYAPSCYGAGCYGAPVVSFQAPGCYGAASYVQASSVAYSFAAPVVSYQAAPVFAVQSYAAVAPAIGYAPAVAVPVRRGLFPLFPRRRALIIR